MYLDYYKLKEKPFQITADPKFLWLGEKHKEAMATLRYGILDNRGFLLLTGEVGTGKTVMINRIVSLLDIDTVVATLPDPDLESMDFYNLLADGLKMDRTFDSKGAFLIHLRDFLHQSYVNKQQVLLIIDESQRLNHRLMEDIRVLSNIELHDRKLINIFFVGQQEFNSILMTPQNRALAQRITVRYHIEPLDLKETGQYIAHRLKVAGNSKEIFKPNAVEKIFQFSGGIPRLINIISDHSMLTGYARDVKQLDDKIICECAEELRIPVAQLNTEAATIQSPVGVTATTEDNRQMPAAVPAAASSDKANEVSGRVAGYEDIVQQPLSWKLIYACVIMLLIGLVAFGVTQFTGKNSQTWDEEDLTPQKYKSTLEKEKALLASQMKDKKEGVEQAPSTETSPEASDTPQASETADENRAAVNNKEDAPTVGDTTNENSEAVDNASDDAADDLQKQIEPLPLINAKLVVQFKTNSNEIEPASYPVLDRVSAYLLENANEQVVVRGYTDSVGSTTYNKSVSQFRASAVKSYLVGKGVNTNKITVFAMGAADPIASNQTFAGRQQNRRVEIEIPSKRSQIN